jgi:hypothetical protein
MTPSQIFVSISSLCLDSTPENPNAVENDIAAPPTYAILHAHESTKQTILMMALIYREISPVGCQLQPGDFDVQVVGWIYVCASPAAFILSPDFCAVAPNLPNICT